MSLNNKKPLYRRILDALHEWESVFFSRKPHHMMLLIILIVNVVVVLLAAWVISALAIPGNENTNFFVAVYNTFTMLLDAGCIASVISNPAGVNVFLIVFCLVVIVICMITFTGALIGYATNVVSNLIEGANLNSVKLKISNHIVVLGWNTRASEIINDLLYCKEKQKGVVLSDSDREEIMAEIMERLNDTVEKENEAMEASIRDKGWLERKIYMMRNRLRNRVAVIVREGDVFSAVHLNNIQLEKAKSIIILGKDLREAIRSGEFEEAAVMGDNRTIKTLMQVVDITCKSTSEDNQKVVVEVENEWTGDLVDKIIKAKQKIEKCRVVPFRVHTVMGQLLSQFCVMPELNQVYSHMFSNKGTGFFAREQKRPDDPMAFAEEYLNTHRRALPLLFIRDEETKDDFFYYMADTDRDIDIASDRAKSICPLKLNPNYWLNERYVLILGSNTKINNVMDSFANFSTEWTNRDHPQIVHVTIVDEEEKHVRADYYKDYPFVETCISANIDEKEKISGVIKDFIYAHPEHSSILILSDDTAPDEEIDAKMMTYLIYAKDIINRTRVNRRDVNFNIDIIAEVQEPRHLDLIRNYDVDNVVISNRYISKMVTQISEDYARYNLFADIMDYDEMETDVYDGIEIYIKKAGEYFSQLPPKNTRVDTLIRSVFEASRRFWGSDMDFAMILGYIDTRGGIHLFGGQRDEQTVSLVPDDKLIVFSNH